MGIEVNILHNKIIELKKNIDISYMKLGGYLKLVNKEKLYLDLDYKTFDEYIAQPELAFERSTAYSIMGVYEDFIESGLSETLDVAGIPYYKLDRIRQFIKEPKRTLEEWILKARELSLSDLNEEIGIASGRDSIITDSPTKWFLLKMEEALKANSWKTPWTELEQNRLYARAIGNLLKLKESKDKEENIKNLIDTANYCMFMADKLREK